MSRRSVLAFGASLVFGLSAGSIAAHDREPPTGSRAQERLEKDLGRTVQRTEEVAARFAEERTKIESRAAQDPEKATRDLQKLEADFARENTKIAEETTKIEADFTKESAKEAEDAAEDIAKLEERGEDSGGSSGSSHMMRDLGESEAAEHDEHGFPVRRGEIVAVDVRPATIAAAEARGFRVINRQRLESLNREVIRIAAPDRMSAIDARRIMLEIDSEAVVDLVHYYGLNLTAGSHGKRVRGAPGPSRQSATFSVGVIDTAIANHAGLAGARIVPWKDGNHPGAPAAHGTAVASLIAGEGRATVYSANIFRGPSSRPFTSADVIAQALEWTLAQGVPTINMSLAGPRNAILDRLIRDALANGRTIVAAAGNGGPTAPPAYPAAVPGVVAVTAVDRNLHVYRYANRGRYITVAAQGVDVIAANAPGGYARFTGTSFATPHVTGWLARCRTGGASAGACNEKLRRSARDAGSAGFDEVYGHGVID
ncbi:MAG: S8 family serine peptidase [Novosphingobium sp.]